MQKKRSETLSKIPEPKTLSYRINGSKIGSGKLTWYFQKSGYRYKVKFRATLFGLLAGV